MVILSLAEYTGAVTCSPGQKITVCGGLFFSLKTLL